MRDRSDLRIAPKGRKVWAVLASTAGCRPAWREQLSDHRFMALSSSITLPRPRPGVAGRGARSRRSLWNATGSSASAEDRFYAHWRDRSCTGSSRKSRRTTSRLRAAVGGSLAQVPAGPANHQAGARAPACRKSAWTSTKLIPHLPHRRGCNSNFVFSKSSVKERFLSPVKPPWTSSRKPILCPRKSGTDVQD